MWLINVETFELEEFLNETKPSYAILSHTWGTKETTFNKFIESTDAAKRDRKIFTTCQLTARLGLRYAWIDTCCIDKRSSAELSEAINSMYRWYQDATVCFVYLEDVTPSMSIPDGIRYCRWRTRGWTLQELIAPKQIQFFDSDWRFRGNKEDLLEPLAEYTRIPVELLARRQLLDSYEAASKMAWASDRCTSRTEDLAYCLMGIFDVNMPLLYGEGPKAFQRLQEEILRKKPEISLLLWQGWTVDGKDGKELARRRSSAGDEQNFKSLASSKSRMTELQPYLRPVLAESPRDFSEADSDLTTAIDEAIEMSLTQQNLVMYNDGWKLEILEFGFGTISYPMQYYPMQYWLDVRGIMGKGKTTIWLPLRKIAPTIFAIESRKEFMPARRGLVSASVMSKMCLVLRPSIHTISRAVEAREGGIRLPSVLLPGFFISAIRPKSHWDPTDQIFFQETLGSGNQAVFAIELHSSDPDDEQIFIILCDPDWSRNKFCKVVRVSQSESPRPIIECSPSLRRDVFGPFPDRGFAWDLLVTRWPEVLKWGPSNCVERAGRRQNFVAVLYPAKTVSFGRTIKIFDLTLEQNMLP